MSFSGGSSQSGYAPPIGAPIFTGTAFTPPASVAGPGVASTGTKASAGAAGGVNNFSAASTPISGGSAAAAPQTIGDAFVNPVGLGAAGGRQLTSPKGGKATLGE